jgi:hypothetical protein
MTVMAYAIGSAANGGIMYSDGTTRLPGSSATNPAYANYQPTNQTPANQPYTPPVNSPAPVGGGGGSTGGGGGDSRLQELQKIDRNPAQETEYQNLLNQLNGGQSDVNALIDEGFNASMGYLSQAEQALQGQYPGVVNDLNAQSAAEVDRLNAGRQTSINQLDATGRQAQTRGESVMDAARRLYQELSTGANQRFGRTSGAGEFAKALFGRDLANNLNTTGNQVNETMTNIGTKRQEVETAFTLAENEAKVRLNSSLNEAKNEFDNKILEINRNRAELAQNKAQLRLQALQDLRNKIFQINLQNMQFQQTLQGMREQAKVNLELYEKSRSGAEQGGASALERLYSSTNTNPTNTTQVGQTQASGTAQAPLVGQVGTPRQDENSIFNQFLLGRQYSGGNA